MRKIRKLFVGLLSLVLAVGMTACASPASAAPDAPDAPLHFRADGSFRVMTISDIQDGADVSPAAITLMSLALDAEKPDMVVLLGDNIFDWSMSLLVSADNVKKSIDTFMAPIIERHVPFAVVFGNHDQTVPFDKEAQWNYFQTLPGALGTMNKIGDRIGNYNLVVNNTDGKPVLNLWFFDSGGSTFSAVGTQMEPEQLQWYTQASNKLTADNGGSPLPAVAFQHIPVPQMYDMLTPVAQGTPDAVQGSGTHAGTYYVANPDMVSDGTVGEGPCVLEDEKAEFDTWRAQGDIMAAVFAHDHDNDFRGTVSGIDLMYDSSVGFYSYGRGYDHGVRVFDFQQDAVKDYQTHMVYWKDLTDQQLSETELYDGTFVHSDQVIYIVIACVLAAVIIAVVLIVVIRHVRRRRARRRAPVGTSTDAS